MNENINLCEILKDCPSGTKFYSYIHGKVEFKEIDQRLLHPIIVEATTRRGFNVNKTFSKEGYYDDAFSGGVCILVPSIEQPDWSKWECPKPKKPKFDPKTLKVFDRVLTKSIIGSWTCDNFSHIDCNGNFICIGHSFVRAIPYNDETKHLVGTTDEAPEYYRHWEE